MGARRPAYEFIFGARVSRIGRGVCGIEHGIPASIGAGIFFAPEELQKWLGLLVQVSDY